MWSEAQQEVQRTTARFVREQLPVAHLRQLRDSRDPVGFSRERWRELARLGLVGAALPESLGGGGLGFTELGLILIECGRTLAPLPWLSTVVLGARALLEHVSLALEHVPAVCAGERILAFAHDEGNRHSRQVSTRAERTTEGYRVRGEKQLVFDAHAADALIVSALGPEGPLLLFVPAQGLAIETERLVDSRLASRVILDVQVPESHVLGGARLLDQLLDGAAIALSAEMLGGTEAVFEETLSYLKTRKQFGVAIGSFQALKHRAAALACEREVLRAVVEEALRAWDRGDPELPLYACAAKARASDVFLQAAAEAIQMHGGIGVTDELDVGLYYKHARVAELSLGDSAFWRERYAQLKGY
jgi:acyl-CoA dehydrogenase